MHCAKAKGTITGVVMGVKCDYLEENETASTACKRSVQSSDLVCCVGHWLEIKVLCLQPPPMAIYAWRVGGCSVPVPGSQYYRERDAEMSMKINGELAVANLAGHEE
jgi:hypothetical protein